MAEIDAKTASFAERRRPRPSARWSPGQSSSSARPRPTDSVSTSRPWASPDAYNRYVFAEGAVG